MTNAARAQDFIAKQVQLLFPNNTKTLIFENARTDPLKTVCNNVLLVRYHRPISGRPQEAAVCRPSPSMGVCVHGQQATAVCFPEVQKDAGACLYPLVLVPAPPPF